MSKTIVFLVDSFAGPWAGTERQLWYLLEGIDRQRYAPYLILLRHSEFSLSTKSWPCPTQVLGVGRLAGHNGVKGLVRLVTLLRNLDAHIVHAYFQDSSFLGPLAARLAGARIVVGRRDMGIWYTRSNLKLLRLTNKLVNRVIANSYAVRKLVVDQESISASRVSVVYNGLDDADDVGDESTILDRRIPPGAPVIGIIANLRPIKRHADLINAFSKIKQEVPSAHLVIVGEGDLETQLRRLTVSLGVDQYTHFLGRIESVRKIIQRFSVGVLCSESEGLSNAIMECLKEGKPVVCTEVGGNSELVNDGENGFLYPVGDEEVLVDRLVRLLKDNRLLLRMGEIAARSVAQLTVANMVGSHMVVYDSMFRATSREKLGKAIRRFFSFRVINPLSDIKSRSIRLATLKKLRCSQWSPRKVFLAEQHDRLREILVHAGGHSPYYRKMFSDHGFDPTSYSMDEFSRLPLLEKEVVRSEIDDLLVEDAVKEKLVKAKTGGSTGKALEIYFDDEWQQRRVADAMRADEWAGWKLGMQKAAVWGNPASPNNWYEKFKDRWLYCLDLYLDTMNISPSSMETFISEWRRLDIDILFGHAHSLYILAEYLKCRKDHGVYPRGIIATSMMLLQNERDVIEKVFSVPVTNRYGCEEVGLIACECEMHKGMHLNIEHLYIEFLNENQKPAKPGEIAEIVVTDLFNRVMPMVRYRVGDMGVFSYRNCECGRELPILEKVVGRTADFLKRKDGTQVAGISLVERTLTAIPGLGQLQLVQSSLNLIEANIVRSEGFTEASGDCLVKELKSIFGDNLDVNLNYMDHIPREASGKYRFSKCLV